MPAGVVTRNGAFSRGMDVYGHSAVCPFQYFGPTAYAAGGELQDDPVFKLGVVEFVPDFLGIPAAGTTAVIYHYNVVTSKMQAFWTNEAVINTPQALVEVANGTDLSTFVGQSVAFGKG